MVKINGKLVSAAAFQTQSSGQIVKARQAMLQQLKSRQMVKNQRSVDLAAIKSTFQTTDLASKEKKKKPAVEDALAQELEGNKMEDDDSDDEEYQPENEQVYEGAVWDEDENIQSAPLQDPSLDPEDFEEELDE